MRKLISDCKAGRSELALIVSGAVVVDVEGMCTVVDGSG